MLIYFSVENFKCIKDRATLDLRAAPITGLEETNITVSEEDRLLKSLAIYGANASGKSSLLDALVDMRWLVVFSAKDSSVKDGLPTTPFLLNAKTAKSPSVFEVCIKIGKAKYRYGFAATTENIVKEWLFEVKKTVEKPLFLRVKQDIKIYDQKSFKGAEKLIELTRPNTLFISVGEQFNIELARKIFDWFWDVSPVHGLRTNLYRPTTIKALKNPETSEIVRKFLLYADLGISGVEIQDVAAQLETLDNLKSLTEEERKRFKSNFENRVFTKHEVYDDNGKPTGRQIVMDLIASGSQGTQKYFDMIGTIISAVVDGSLILIDEFDARLHPLLSTALIKLFNSSKIKSNLQVIFSTHDVALLDRDLLRRDQIYFVEKNQNGAASLYSLAEFKPRKVVNFEKNYLTGKYGAIPMVDDLELSLARKANGKKANGKKAKK